MKLAKINFMFIFSLFSSTLHQGLIFLVQQKEVKSQFTDWLRLDSKSQVSDSMSNTQTWLPAKTPQGTQEEKQHE